MRKKDTKKGAAPQRNPAEGGGNQIPCLSLAVLGKGGLGWLGWLGCHFFFGGGGGEKKRTEINKELAKSS